MGFWTISNHICIFHSSYCCGVNIFIGQFMEMIIANLSNSLTDLFSVGRAATTKMSQIYEICNCFMHFLHLNFAPLWCIVPKFSLQFLGCVFSVGQPLLLSLTHSMAIVNQNRNKKTTPTTALNVAP